MKINLGLLCLWWLRHRREVAWERFQRTRTYADEQRFSAAARRYQVAAGLPRYATAKEWRVGDIVVAAMYNAELETALVAAPRQTTSM